MNPIRLLPAAFVRPDGTIIQDNTPDCTLYPLPSPEEGRKRTLAHRILAAHHSGGSMDHLRLHFDALASHDITFVNIIQTARASGLTEFPLPYVLTNCHNSLCAVGGTINEDDHLFGLSAAEKYGGVFVPAHLAVIHQFMREEFAAVGSMILGSDSHTRYGCFGALGVGEGGGELAKQLLGRTYDIDYPQVIGVCLTGRPAPWVGPQDVALAIIGAVFKNCFVQNKVMEFFGDGIAHLSVDFRNGIDVMTTETTCWSSIWPVDGQVREYYRVHGREGDFKPLALEETAYYDGVVVVDLAKIQPMIALPFHPSNVYTIEAFNNNAADILREAEVTARQQLGADFTLADKLVDGKLTVSQGIVAGRAVCRPSRRCSRTRRRRSPRRCPATHSACR